MRGRFLALIASLALWAALPGRASAAKPAVPTPLPMASTTDNSEAQSDALQRKLAELDRLQSEIAELRAATGTLQSIQVSVEMLEVSLTKLRKLGIDIHASPGELIDAGSLGLLSGESGTYTPPGENGSDGKPAGAAPEQGDSAAGLLNLLRQNNVARMLANPCVVVVSGKPASLFVGEQIPLPPAGDRDAIEFQEAGTRLDVLAESLGDRRVRLYIRPRISTARGAQFDVDGVPVRTLSVQQCDLSCETTLGEAVVLSGLVTERVEATVRDGGQVEETINEIALWIIVRADDAAAPRRVAARVPRRPPAPHDARRR
jgi:Flp pilus assembly secretin CpaC